MSVEYKLDGKLLRFIFEGSTMQEELYKLVHTVFQEHEYDDDAVVLSDLRGSTSLATRGPQVVEMLSEFVLSHPGRPGDRVAVLLPEVERDRLEAGVDDLAKKTGVQIGLFVEESPALVWLGVAKENRA